MGKERTRRGRGYWPSKSAMSAFISLISRRWASMIPSASWRTRGSVIGCARWSVSRSSGAASSPSSTPRPGPWPVRGGRAPRRRRPRCRPGRRAFPPVGIHLPHEQEHDDGHRRAHHEGHVEPCLAPVDVVERCTWSRYISTNITTVEVTIMASEAFVRHRVEGRCRKRGGQLPLVQEMDLPTQVTRRRRPFLLRSGCLPVHSGCSALGCSGSPSRADVPRCARGDDRQGTARRPLAPEAAATRARVRGRRSEGRAERGGTG